MLDDVFELKVLACIYRSSDFCQVSVEYLKPKYFNTDLRINMAKMGLDFFKKYKTTISQMGYVDSVKKLMGKKIILKEERDAYIEEYKTVYQQDISDYKYVLDKLVSFIKQQEMKLLIEQSVTKFLPNEDFDSIEQKMRDIASITAQTSVVHTDYKANLEERLVRRNAESGMQTMGITTGIDKLNEIMNYRGWMPGELYCVGGSAKAGKSQALAYFANVAASYGNNVAFFTLEVSTDVITDRIDALNTDIRINELKMYNDEVVDKFKNMDYKGNLYIFDYPTKKCSVDEIERQVTKMEIERGIKVDVLVVDYLGIVKPAHRGEKWEVLEEIAEDLRALAKEHNLPVLTAHQLTRGSSKKKVTSGDDLAGSWAVVGVVDGLITLSGDTSMRDRGELIVRCSEFRNCSPAMFRISTEYSKGKFFGSMLGEEF